MAGFSLSATLATSSAPKAAVTAHTVLTDLKSPDPAVRKVATSMVTSMGKAADAGDVHAQTGVKILAAANAGAASAAAARASASNASAAFAASTSATKFAPTNSAAAAKLAATLGTSRAAEAAKSAATAAASKAKAATPGWVRSDDGEYKRGGT